MCLFDTAATVQATQLIKGAHAPRCFLHGPDANHGVSQLVGTASAAQRKPIAGERSIESESSSQRLCCKRGPEVTGGSKVEDARRTTSAR